MNPLIFAFMLSLPLDSIPTVEITSVQEHKIREGFHHAILAAIATTQFGDVATTEFALGTGKFKEHNPLLKFVTTKDPVYLAIIKSGVTLGMMYLTMKLYKANPKLAMVVGCSFTAITGYAVYANSSNLRKHGFIQ